jgi:hypothetical protein
MSVGEITESVQAQLLEALKQYQELVLDAVRNAAETVDGIIPTRPELPFASSLPRPTKVAGTAFDFAEKLLANQREFVTEVLSVTEPYVTGSPAPKKTTTKTKSTAA